MVSAPDKQTQGSDPTAPWRSLSLSKFGVSYLPCSFSSLAVSRKIISLHFVQHFSCCNHGSDALYMFYCIEFLPFTFQVTQKNQHPYTRFNTSDNPSSGIKPSDETQSKCSWGCLSCCLLRLLWSRQLAVGEGIGVAGGFSHFPTSDSPVPLPASPSLPGWRPRDRGGKDWLGVGLGRNKERMQGSSYLTRTFLPAMISRESPCESETPSCWAS